MNSITGFQRFIEYFSDFKNQFVVIGGAAGSLLSEKYDISFRATRDIDIVLLVEALTPDFGRAFWRFVKEGGYKLYKNNADEVHFFRFMQPKNPDYPYMLELFAKSQNALSIPEDIVYGRLSFEEEVSSLSAILLNEAYYDFLHEGITEINGCPVIDETHIIPFKIKAHLDLVAKHNAGLHVNEKDLKKHKNDVFRFAVILNAGTKIPVPPELAAEIKAFIEQMRKERINLKNLGIEDFTQEEILMLLETVYLS